MPYRPLPPIRTVPDPPPPTTKPEEAEKLTPKQIENWRRVLVGIIGPYALIMPEADIQAYRDKMQKMSNPYALIMPEADIQAYRDKMQKMSNEELPK
jgi:hypothetical protein